MGFDPAAQVNVTVTFVSFHPFELGEGDTEAMIDGGVGAAV